MCGAVVSSDQANCKFCEARLATVACPSCFALMFLGSKHCPRCGAKAERNDAGMPQTQRRCPRCHIDLGSIKVGETTLRECARCAGLWVDLASFEAICADREHQSAVLGTPSPVTRDGQGLAKDGRIQYVPCPECGELMNRVNFARCSGVIVDVCKGHGTWFDANELPRIIEFIREGGLESSRLREKQELAEEWQRLRLEKIALSRGQASTAGSLDADAQHSSVIAAARELLKLLVE